jgi:hypothetical protein
MPAKRSLSCGHSLSAAPTKPGDTLLGGLENLDDTRPM